ncbi:MAG: inositol monophosphatase [Pseudomonadota bacterium]
MQINHDDIASVIREAAQQHILPLWQNLEDHHIDDKGGGDLVTAADHACEEFLSTELAKLIRRSLVVGEEAVAADETALSALDTDQPVWVIDPLDGTRNFANQRQPFGVMVCLVKGGESLAGWIYDPIGDSLLSAEQQAGCLLDGERIKIQGEDKDCADMHGALMTTYLPSDLREHVRSKLDTFLEWKSYRCAAHDYRRLVTGEVDFLLYYRTFVWDHAPGALIAQEAGASIARYDGSLYSPRGDGKGLLCANTPNNWAATKALLIPEAFG